MGLISDVQSQQRIGLRDTLRADEAPKAPRVTQLGVLIRIANRVLELNCGSTEERERATEGGYRFRTMDASWPALDLIGKVDERTWSSMVAAALHGMELTILNAQNNGRWTYVEYELDVAERFGVEELMLAVKWVDMLNAPDLRYHNGVPAVDLHLHTPALPAELLEFLKKKADATDGAGGAAGNSELAAALNGMTAAFERQTQLLQQMAASQPQRPNTKIKSDAQPE